MATPKTFGRGSFPNQIEFDPARALSTAGANGDLYRGILHLSSYPNGLPFEYHNVALKRMRWGTDDKDTRLHRIIDESHVWKRAIHPNILRFLGLLYEDGELYLVAPFAPHGTVSQYIVAHPDANRPMLLWQVSAGIAHLHEKEIIHGDLKGANVLIFDGPVAKICDFGLSKVYDGKQTTTSQYSVPWASPERLLGEPRSYLSDIYAFGMLIYEILSGKTPFSTLEGVACVRAILDGEKPPKHPKFSGTGVSYTLLWTLAEQCWRHLPDERPSMTTVRDSIGPAEESLVTDGDLDGLPLLNFPRASWDVVGHKRKRAKSISDPKASIVLDGLVRTHAEGPWAEEAAPDVQGRRDAKRLKLQGESVVGENVECEWIVNSPAVTHGSQQDTFMNTWVGVHRAAPRSLAITNLDDEMDDLRIIGATVVRHDDIKNLTPLRNRNKVAGFWNDVVEADVANKRSLVKMYYKRSGGEKAFLRDIERLGHCLFGLPRIRAYCLKASVPFIVLEAESTTPLKDHLLDLAKNLAVDVADKKIWNMIANLNTAANFVSAHCQDIRISALSAALKDVRVDQNGRIAIAPDWSNDVKNLMEEDHGATELTRNMLKEMLMGDHTFHRLSCISFTFGAASWDYMSREEVLDLSDAATAKAHLCAHADAPLSPARRDNSAKQAYEAWTQCPCLRHGVTPPPPSQPMAHKLSKFDNQALRLGLSSQEQSAVSNLIDLMVTESLEQPDVTVLSQKSDTLPPSVWALLLIADGSQHLPGAVPTQQDPTRRGREASSPLQQQQQQQALRDQLNQEDTELQQQLINLALQQQQQKRSVLLKKFWAFPEVELRLKITSLLKKLQEYSAAAARMANTPQTPDFEMRMRSYNAQSVTMRLTLAQMEDVYEKRFMPNGVIPSAGAEGPSGGAGPSAQRQQANQQQQQQQQGDMGVLGAPHLPGWPANMTPQQRQQVMTQVREQEKNQLDQYQNQTRQRPPAASFPPQQTSPQLNPQAPGQQWERFFMDAYNIWLRKESELADRSGSQH